MLYFFIFVLYEIFFACVVFVLYAGCKKKQKNKNDMFYFSARGTRSGILCYIFPRVERALEFCVIFSVHGERSGIIVLYFSACGTCSGFIVLYFPHVERALASFCCIFSACGTRSGVIVLYFLRVERALALFCYIFPHVERALALFCYILRACNALWYFVSNSFHFVMYLPCFSVILNFLLV